MLDELLTEMYRNFKKTDDVNWYHLMVKCEYEEHWMQTWEKYGGMAVKDIACHCTTVGGRDHVHIICCFPIGKNTNTFNKAFNLKYKKKISPFITSADARKQRAERRKYYLKPIKTAIHLLHVVLYISTKHTKGFHSGELTDCEHFNHTFMAFETKKQMNTWRRDVYLPAHPDIAKEMNDEWEKFEKEKEAKAAENVDKDVTKCKIGLYNGEKIKRHD